MAANLTHRGPITGPSLSRLLGSLDQIAEGLEVLEAELLVSALRNQTHLSTWTHDRLAQIAQALDDLRDAVETAPRTSD